MPQESVNCFVGIPKALSVSIWVFLFCFVFYLIFRDYVYYDSSLSVVYFSLLLYVFILFIGFCVFYRGGGFFHPVVFVILWVGVFTDIIRKVGVYWFGLDGHQALHGFAPYDLAIVVSKSLLLSSISFLAIYVGYFIKCPFKVPILIFRRPRALRLKVLLVVMMAIGAFLYIVIEAGGLAQLLLQRGMPRELRVINRVGAHWYLLIGSLTSLSLILITHETSLVKKRIILLFFVLSLILVFASTGSRSGVVMPVILLLSISVLATKRIRMSVILIVAGFGVFAIGMLGQFRMATMGMNTLDEVVVESSVSSGFVTGIEMISGYSGGTSGMYGIVGKVPAEEEWLLGESYLSIIAAPIPRAIWPDKPNAGGRLTGERIFKFGQAGAAVPPSATGEAFWNFGFLGVFVIMTIYGVFLRYLGELYLENKRGNWVILFYIATLFIFRPSSDGVYVWLHTIVPFLMVYAFLFGFPSVFILARRGVVASKNESIVSS